MTLHVGTSGFAYKEWKPGFYPADLPAKDFLRYYATRFTSVEINNTFYRAPTDEVVGKWAEQTPETFAFTLKAPQRITHIKRLREVEEPLTSFLRTARTLDDRLGVVLFQCPPNLKRDDALLADFLALLPGAPFRFALEFRNPTWEDPAVFDAMAANRVAWCVADTDEKPAVMRRTADDFAYLRLRGLDYTDEDLARWAKEVAGVLGDGGDAFVYFKHEDDPSAIRYARRIGEILS